MPQSQLNEGVEEKFEETTETVQMEQSLLPLFDDKPLKRKGPNIKKDDSKSEEPLFKQGLKLRKTETVKRPIEKAAIEVPKLKHYVAESLNEENSQKPVDSSIKQNKIDESP